MDFQWQIGGIDFHLVRGDLFEVPVDAIVNSDQTDFVLARNPWTVSGQIRYRYGEELPSSLLGAQTNEWETPPHVRRTDNVGDYQAIFHAGFHEPHQWLDERTDSEQTEYVKYITTCVREILEEAHEQQIESVAFPLIGTGLFNLDPELLVYEFGREVDSFAREMPDDADMEIWLVVYRRSDRAEWEQTVRGFGQAMIDCGMRKRRGKSFNLGIELLDRLERRAHRTNHSRWATWEFLQYAEQVTNLMYARLSREREPDFSPVEPVEEDRPVSFGLVRHELMQLVDGQPRRRTSAPWASFFEELVATDTEKSQPILHRLRDQRNHIAHGRHNLVEDEKVIREWLHEFLSPASWRERVEESGPPPFKDVEPWIVPDVKKEEAPLEELISTSIGPDAGVFERYEDETAFTYVNPLRGRRFRLSGGRL